MSNRIEVFIEAPNLDAQDIEFRLPEGVTICGACRGNGKRKQCYCDAPSMTGPCDWCQATGFRHENSGAAVSASVVNQIAVMNALEVRHTMYGNDWKPAMTAVSDETGRETCWLIEQTRHTVYLMADGNYTRDPLKASRFATRGEADAVLRSLNLNAALYKETIVTEHVFLNNAALSAAPVAQEPVAALCAANTANYLRILARESESAFDKHELKRSAELIEAVTAPPPATSAGLVLETLREHHNWHLQSGTIGLQDGDGGWVEIDNGAEYFDSALYERTAKLLEGAPPEELQPMPRGGMNTWWWQQAVLLRRKVRELTKTIEANAALASPSLSAAPVETWKCAARKQSLPEPADCGWPTCGCDPYADKVIAALEEQGHAAPVAPTVAAASPTCKKCGGSGYTVIVEDYCDYTTVKCPDCEAPPATSAGVGADEIARACDDLRGIGHCGESTSDKIARQRRDAVIDEVRAAILALLSRAGDQSNSTQKDGSR